MRTRHDLHADFGAPAALPDAFVVPNYVAQAYDASLGVLGLELHPVLFRGRAMCLTIPRALQQAAGAPDGEPDEMQVATSCIPSFAP